MLGNGSPGAIYSSYSQVPTIYKDLLNDSLIAQFVLVSDNQGAIHSTYSANNTQGLFKG